MKTKRSFYNKVLFCTLVSFLIVLASSHSFGYQWSKTFGGSEDERGYSVQQTVDGGYIIAGRKNYGDWSGNADVYLLKTDAFGNESWSKTLGGNWSDGGYSVQQTGDGGYIIAGYTFSIGSADITDVYLIKTDALGDESWSKTFAGGMGYDMGYSVQQTEDGGYIIAGHTSPFVGGWHEVCLIKTDNLGNESWSKTLGGSGDDIGRSVQQTEDGGYIIAGYAWNNNPYQIGRAEYTDVDLIKADALGNESWSKTFGGGWENYGYSVQQTEDGSNTIDWFTYTFGDRYAGYGGGSYVYLIKTDALGNESWSNTFGGGMTEDYGYSVQQTEDGGYIIAGHTYDYESADVYLIKTDALGNESWSRTFGGSMAHDMGYSVQQTEDGGYIIAGCSYPTGSGNGAVYLIKTDALGNESWSKTFGGSIHAEGYSVQQTEDGGYIIAGHTNWYGNEDVYLIYYKPCEFADVPPGHWAEEYICRIYDEGITTGCGGSNYCPNDDVTREQMAAFIVRAVEGEPDANYCGTGSPFSDVPATSVFCKYIKRLSELGITQGCGGGKFCPKTIVTREQMAAFLVRAVEGEPDANYCDTGSPFSDVSPASVFCKYIKRLSDLEITKGCGGDKYCPKTTVKRDQMAVFLGRAFLGMD